MVFSSFLDGLRRIWLRWLKCWWGLTIHMSSLMPSFFNPIRPSFFFCFPDLFLSRRKFFFVMKSMPRMPVLSCYSFAFLKSQPLLIQPPSFTTVAMTMFPWLSFGLALSLLKFRCHMLSFHLLESWLSWSLCIIFKKEQIFTFGRW